MLQNASYIIDVGDDPGGGSDDGGEGEEEAEEEEEDVVAWLGAGPGWTTAEIEADVDTHQGLT